MNTKNTFHCFLFFVLLGWVLFSGCKKSYEKSPYANIERFSLADANGNIIQASISGGKIKIYWPDNQVKMDSIMPEIVISRGASISPASGKKVKLDSLTKYTITAEDGQVALYQLEMVNNQPIPSLTSFGYEALGELSMLRMPLQSSVPLVGNYFIADTARTHVFLVFENGRKDLPVNLTRVSLTSILLNLSVLPLSSGEKFKIKLVTGSRMVVFERIYTVADPKTKLTNPATKLTVKAGETFKFSGVTLGAVSSATIAVGYNLPAFPLEIINKSADEITFKLPPNIPAGYYGLIAYDFAASAYQTAGSNSASFDAANLEIIN